MRTLPLWPRGSIIAGTYPLACSFISMAAGQLTLDPQEVCDLKSDVFCSWEVFIAIHHSFKYVVANYRVAEKLQQDSVD